MLLLENLCSSLKLLIHLDRVCVFCFAERHPLQSSIINDIEDILHHMLKLTTVCAHGVLFQIFQDYDNSLGYFEREQ